MHANRRILIESTATFDTRITTGIQRVVRNIVREACLQGPSGMECVPVVYRGGNFYDARAAWHRRLQQRRHPSHRRTGNATVQRAGRRIHKALYPRTMRRWITNSYWRTTSKHITFGKGDVLLLLDETFRMPVWSAVQHASQQGCRVGGLVYDLVPVDFPHFFKEPFPEIFRNWIEVIANHSDFLVAISKTVRNRLESHLCEMGHTFSGPFGSFRLGSDLPEATDLKNIRPILRTLFTSSQEHAPHLAVGTLEPRKNHDCILDAFESFWLQYPETPLCIVGRVGWKCRELMRRIARHPARNTSLFLFNDLTDEELSFCYDHAKSLVTASFAEGFGLPIVEAISRGLPVFASDIAIHREVGGDVCSYFDPRNPSTLTDRLIQSQGNNRTFSSVADTVISWSASYSELLTQVLRCSRNQSRTTRDARTEKIAG